MIILNWIVENWLALIGIFLSTIALILQLKDKAKVRILDINVGFGSFRSVGQDKPVESIYSISVNIENTGGRSAMDCEGTIIFAKRPVLILHPHTIKNTVDTNNRLFDIHPNTKKSITGAFGYSHDGAIDSSKGTMTPTEFIEHALPLTAVITYGGKRIEKIYTKEEFQKKYQDFQFQMRGQI